MCIRDRFMLTCSAFELFPPGKRNLLVARFVAPVRLCALRKELWELCTAAGVALADDGEWIPHVTLGKFRATKAQAGRLTCAGLVERLADADDGGDQDRTIGPVVGMRCGASGTMLVGEQPRRAPLCWKWDRRWRGEA